MKVRTIRELRTKESRQFPTGIRPVGTVIDQADLGPEDGLPVFWLVRMGVAIPEDDEAAQAADMTPTKMAAAQRAYERVSRGIHPDDYAAFDRGEMTGYDEDGNPIPGPNAPYEGNLILPEP